MLLTTYLQAPCVHTFLTQVGSLSINSLAVLSKCNNLQTLDLSCVSEAIPYRSLFNSTCTLSSLVSLHLPRAFQSEYVINDSILDLAFFAGQDFYHVLSEMLKRSEPPFYPYPPNLQRLYISGYVDETTLFLMAQMPTSVTGFHIDDCRRIRCHYVYLFLHHLQNRVHLDSLSIGATNPARPEYQHPHFLLPSLPTLKSLTVDGSTWLNGDYPGLLRPGPHADSEALPCLRTLTFRGKGRVVRRNAFAWASIIYQTIDEDSLPALRKIFVDSRLGWVEDRRRARNSADEFVKDITDLDDLLKALTREDLEDSSSERQDKSINEESGGIVVLQTSNY